MKYIKLFESYTESDIAEICKKYAIENWSINSEGLVDVDGNVDLSLSGLKKIPLRFGHVSGYFKCPHNHLTNLEGCPHTVGRYFDCNNNELTSLEGCPQKVGRGFYCWNNQLTSLKGCPQEVGGGFYCRNNKLTSLEGCPKSVGGHFSCGNSQLTSLRFAPEYIEGEVFVLPNPIEDIPGEYLTKEYIQFIIKEQYDWNLYRKDGTIYLERLEQMIEWGIETNKIEPI
jgi:hypothetical protein